jgi:hypothetical protein
MAAETLRDREAKPRKGRNHVAGGVSHRYKTHSARKPWRGDIDRYSTCRPDGAQL